jgi:hypothetical protein
MLMTRVKVAALLLAVGVAGGGLSLYGQRAGEGGSRPAAAGEPARPPEPAATHPARIAATVNGEAILADEAYAAAYLSLPDAHDPAAPDRSRRVAAVRRKTLDRLIEREVILRQAIPALKTRNAQVADELREVAADEFGRRRVRAARRSAGLTGDAGLRASPRARGTSDQAPRPPPARGGRPRGRCGASGSETSSPRSTCGAVSFGGVTPARPRPTRAPDGRGRASSPG